MALQLVECPRDAWQSYPHIVPTEVKIAYLSALLEVGFHTLDAGSFVSPKAVPQMADTAEVFSRLPWQAYPQTGLLAIIVNEKGLQQAISHPAVKYVGYPLSLSETFQQQNARQSVAEAKNFIPHLVQACTSAGKIPVVYLSMGFGNPYGEPYAPEIVVEMGGYLQEVGVSIVSIADTVGIATPDDVYATCEKAVSSISNVVWGVHLHAHPHNAHAKVAAAWEAGIRRYDSALGGYGGCPFAGTPLVSNLRTETLLEFLREQLETLPIREEALSRAQALLPEAFPAG